MTAEQIDGSTEIELVMYNNQLSYSQYRWREMIIFKIINLALKDIDAHGLGIQRSCFQSLLWAVVCPNSSIKSHDCVVEEYTCVNILK